MKHPLKIILGPPGTGKTSQLLSIVDGYLERGISPEEICFVSFTKKASNEARERAIKKFPRFKPEEFKWFRTIHSMAFQVMKIDKKDVMGFSNYIDICKQMGLTLSSQRIQEDGTFAVVHTKGDRLFFLENLARATNKTLAQVHIQFPDDDLNLKELTMLANTIKSYKQHRSKLDFTDMIDRFIKEGKSPEFKVCIVDEGQDLSPIQWKMVEILFNNSDNGYVAGDDDQAIFTWAGADVNYFQQMTGIRTVLSQSYRVPKEVHKLASRVLKRIKIRSVKAYQPTEIDGKVSFHDNLDRIDMSKGSWLLLSRNIFFLNIYCQYCLSKGYLFESKYGSPITEGASEAVKYWEELRAGGTLQMWQARMVYEFMSVKVRVKFGFKSMLEQMPDDMHVTLDDLLKKFGLMVDTKWQHALNRLTRPEIAYFEAAAKIGDRIDKEPRIKISTIHGVKGGEADNVVLISDMSMKTYDEYVRNNDDENRVWYVGITRAKSSVHIIRPTTSYAYEL